MIKNRSLIEVLLPVSIIFYGISPEVTKAHQMENKYASYQMLTAEDILLQFQESIEGQVTDADTGELLPGVNIMVKDTDTGAATDAEGKFTLSIPSLSDILIFSYVGYQTMEVSINGQTELNVELQPQMLTGKEMVVVGYGTQRKINQTGAVSSIEFDQNLENMPITNASQALAGKVPGCG